MNTLSRLAALLVLSSACASAPPPQTSASSLPELEPEKVSSWGPQSPQPDWWNEPQPCPEGSKLVGQFPPKGNVVECLTPTGVRQGRSSVWFPNGHEGTFAEYKNGVQHGHYMHWLEGRKMMEGTFDTGRRHGEWTYWFDETSDFDTQARMEVDQPVVVEVYNHGMLVNAERAGQASPEELSPEPKHDSPPPKTASE